MEGVTMPLIPSIVFAKESSGDPATYIPYTSYFGSVYSGGNVGSMKIDGKKTALNFTENVIIYNKLVGGCNNANVASTEFNAAYDGGFIGTPDTNGDKLQLNLSGLRMQPKRWKKNIGDYYTPELAERESYDTDPGYTDYVIDANGNHLLEWNTISSITGKEVRPVLSGTGISSDDDKARRFIGGNVYGGCYNSGHINGNVIINMNSTLIRCLKTRVRQSYTRTKIITSRHAFLVSSSMNRVWTYSVLHSMSLAEAMVRTPRYGAM